MRKGVKTLDTSYPNLVVHDTIHCSIDKLCNYLKVRVITVPTNIEHWDKAYIFLFSTQ